MADFPSGTINIRYNTDNWGPYSFDFTNSVFSGDSVSDVTVKAYLGNVKPTDDLDDETDLTTELIDSDFPPSVSDNVVSVYFKYPGDSYKGNKITLIFEITLTGTGVHPFYFQYVKIQ